jgi:DNA-binding transcriptional ArsR family regulator
MAITVDVGVGELAATRFGMSPLGETVYGLQSLARAVRTPALLPWLTWARAELRRSGLRLPVAWPLLATDRPGFPEFLAPAPARPEPTIDEELAVLRRTRAAQVRASLRRVFGPDLLPGVAEAAERPAAVLREVAAELRAAYELLVAPHWPRLRALLHADIGYRARQLALGGAAELFGDLSRTVTWQPGRLVIDKTDRDRVVTLGSRGLVLVPTVLGDGAVRIKGATSTQITLRYQARGVATAWSASPDDPPGGLVRLLGRPRARVLEALRAPHTTGGLAAQLGVTPGAVSQHLAVLRVNRLIQTERTGRTALHTVTDLGMELLNG